MTMSAAIFQQFLDQIEAKDYAKAQGFDLSWYDQMSQNELEEAERLLLEQARTGDMSPIPSLAKLATPAAINFLKQTFEEKKYDSKSLLNYELAKYLWENTSDIKYLKVFDEYELKSKTDKLLLIKLLSGLPDIDKRIKQLLDFVKNDTYSVARFQAAKEIMQLVGIIKPDYSNLEDYRPILSKVASEELKERVEGQKELSHFINLHQNAL